MNAEGFKDWLLSSGQMKSAAENRVANCITVEREQHVDLDVCYVNDRCEHLLYLLTYSREDQRRKNLPRHCIHKDGDIYNGTATYKSAVKKYVAFKDAGGTVCGKPISPKVVSPKVRAKPMESDVANDQKNGDEEFKDILKNFHSWLIEEAELMPKAADQYKTYINKLRLAVDGHFGQGWFESLPSAYLKFLSEEKLIQCSFCIEANLRNAPKAERKAWHNWRSAFHRFEEFLHDIADVYNKDATTVCQKKAKGFTAKRNRKAKRAEQVFVVDGVAPYEVVATYTQKELARAFMGRLKTQSRYYPRFDLLFPTRLLTKIFKGRKSDPWIEWLKSDLNDMRILMPNNASVSFTGIEQFEFYGNGTVVITKNDGVVFEMMTHTENCKKIVKEEAKRGLRDISIDHVKPLEEVLRRNKDRLNGLRRLTELFWEFEKEIGRKLNPRAEKDWVNDFYNQFRPVLDTDDMRTLIAEDLNILDLEYELMDTTYNTMKGKRT